jgi:hypothetical protein
MIATDESATNDYLQQVVEQQARVDRELRRQAPLRRARGLGKAPRASDSGLDFEEGASTAAPAANYRITGWLWWKTVVVPPNMYVVHTRRDHAEPLHVGLGASFRYHSDTDAFLVIPAAVQTLMINARCICAERQGVLVQAYVQWVVGDVYTAYRKLDFSDRIDPMRIVNLQLREQAEAAIKDKVATMSIDAILTDKQPIIEELTHRLRVVAEGEREDGSGGLGLKIVTVQIKEAVVSSTRLWENLQKPFRADRAKLARMAELEAEQQIAARELASRRARESAELDHERRMAQLRAEQERETYDRQHAEAGRRLEVEQEAEQKAVAQRTETEKARKEAELDLALKQLEIENRRLSEELAGLQRQIELERARNELERLRTQETIDRDNLLHRAQSERGERDLELAQLRRQVENDVTEPHLRAQLIARLPQIAAALPKPNELKAVSIAPGADGAGALTGFLAAALQLAEGLVKTAGNGRPPTPSETKEGDVVN